MVVVESGGGWQTGWQWCVQTLLMSDEDLSLAKNFAAKVQKLAEGLPLAEVSALDHPALHNGEPDPGAASAWAPAPLTLTTDQSSPLLNWMCLPPSCLFRRTCFQMQTHSASTPWLCSRFMSNDRGKPLRRN